VSDLKLRLVMIGSWALIHLVVRPSGYKAVAVHQHILWRNQL